LRVRAAAAGGIRQVVLVRDGVETETLSAGADGRIADGRFALPDLHGDDYAYVRVDVHDGHMAWASPVWGATR
jgi:hypothetical protein